jgi:hypothetical protein
MKQMAEHNQQKHWRIAIFGSRHLIEQKLMPLARYGLFLLG